MNCYYCEIQLNEVTKTSDHIIPVSRDGNNSKLNKVDCCRRCNNLKGNRLPEEFRTFLVDTIEGIQSGFMQKFHKDYVEYLRVVLINNSHLIRSISTHRHKLLKGYHRITKPVSVKRIRTIREKPINVIPLESKDHQEFLMTQTPEQFKLAKLHGWKIAKMLTEPEPNFHYE